MVQLVFSFVIVAGQDVFDTYHIFFCKIEILDQSGF